ncbi:DUF5060 domain-containing protein [Saccharicrinis sp. FJH54]|uniref:DUF5060 domain-containing protein n=1 Tax=Saccharicrinis sp. FJH54 TaxID=3344665 RepID=UPI0035D45A8C
MKRILSALLSVIFTLSVFASEKVSQYRMFETTVKNRTKYDNKFTDVELDVVFTSPSGIKTAFWGYYDGDGKGDGTFQNGMVWKIRFMPGETGIWNYEYSWSDSTKGGTGQFECIADKAGKGILQAYKDNPHWLAYNGTDPVWLKSYYETGHGSIGQNFDWITENVYQRLKDNGYNHVQVNWLLSLCCFGQYYHDGPEPEIHDLTLYREGELYTSMNLKVWHLMEQHLDWFNRNDIGVHMFLGVDGSKNDGPAWKNLSPDEKRFLAKYMVARLAPFANIAGWNYVWEVPGDREGEELGFARLIREFDVFHHMITYEDEFPRENHYDLPEYTFAAVENHEIAAPEKDMERNLWKEPWTHHMACLLGYKGKPVYMTEGNALWRRFWQERTAATQDDLRRSAWACVTAGASFTWNGHAGEYELVAHGPEGLPFSDDNSYHHSEQMISILARTMSEDVIFYRMEPHDELLSRHPALRVYALAEPGNQYLVFDPEGVIFALHLEPGVYADNLWLNAETGEKLNLAAVTVKENEPPMEFLAPDQRSDWVLILKK